MNEVTQSSMSFDRMRTMLVRAAEIRESEQQQIFDALDEIHGKLAALESIGSIRKRVADLPDRTEVSVLAERLDETVAKLEANDNALASLSRSVESIVDKLAKPFAQLDGRLDAMAGKFEGVAGRMAGLEDKLANIHRRLDELELHLDKQDNKAEALPREINANVKDRLETFESGMQAKFADLESDVRAAMKSTSETLTETRAELANTRSELSDKLAAGTEELQGAIAETTDVLHGKLAESHAVATDPSRFDAVNERIEALAGAVESINARIDTVESDLGARVTGLGSELRTELAGMREGIDNRPSSEAIENLVRAANAESEQRNASQLDEAMATFAELILGGGPANMQAPATAVPRQTSRRRSTKARTNGNASSGTEDAKETEDENI